MKKTEKRIRADLLPGILTMILLPLVAKGQKTEVDLGKYSWFPDGSFQYDFFMYWKGIVFLILVAAMLLVLIDRSLLRGIRIKNWKYFIPLYVYAGVTILSTILSADKALSLKGMWQQYESVWVLLGYLVTVFYCVQVTESEEDVKKILWALAAGTVAPAVIGLTQMAGKDFFYTSAGKGILSAGLDSAAKDAMSYLYSGSGNSTVYMASYTPNYAGVYLVMVLPVVVILTITAAGKAGRIFGGSLSIILCICLYGTGSRTGLAVGCILAILAVYFRQSQSGRQRGTQTDTGSKDGKNRWAYTGIAVLLVVVLFIGYDLAGSHRLINGIRDSLHKNTYDMQEIQPGENGITVKYKDNTLELMPETTEMGQMLNAVSNKKDKLTAIWDTDSQCFRFRDTVYEDLAFDTYSQDQISYIMVSQGDITWNFFKEPDGEKYFYLNQYGKSDEIRNAAAVLKGYERAFSGRGYIWGRTIPLIAKHLLWGSGPDTFAAEFPQTDYVMKANTSLSMYQQLPTRAHNMYLQSALQTGVISAICLIIFWLRYVISFVKRFRKSTRDKVSFWELGIFLSVTGFLLMGIMNDSNLAAAPVFWCLLGTGIAMETFHGRAL